MKSGFTLSELLITLLILGFVGALGVPMLGQQKLKKPVTTKTVHGTFECYYEAQDDGTYTLKQWRADNKGNKALSSPEDHCTFVPPKNANFFVITVIGAGQDGFPANGDASGYQPKYGTAFREPSDEKSGDIRINEYFQSDLNSAPEWVRTYWDSQWNNSANGETPNIIPTYELLSPIGKGGDSYCKRGVNASPSEGIDCSKCGDGNGAACNDACYDYAAALGTNSSRGKEVTVVRKLLTTDNVEYTTGYSSTKLSFGNDRYVQLTAAGAGKDATEKNLTGVPVASSSVESEYTCQGLSSSECSSPKENGINLGGGQSNGIGCSSNGKSISGESADEGRITELYYSKIPYEYEELLLPVSFAPSGAAGKVITRIYERITNALELYPAEASSSSSRVYTTGKDSKSVLAETETVSTPYAVWDSSEPGNNRYYVNTNFSAEELTFPFPSNSKYNINSFGIKTVDISTIPLSTDYTSKIANIGYNIGASGSGSFPVLTPIELTSWYIINGVTLHSSSNASSFSAQASEYNCPYGAEKVSYNLPSGSGWVDSTGYYCEATKGKPGAIVITW